MASLPRSFTSIGGDTQILGNFEYRIPVIGNTVGLAAFADIGTAFNLAAKAISSSRASSWTTAFLQTVGFIPCTVELGWFAPVSLSTARRCNAIRNSRLPVILGLVMRDNRMVTTRNWTTHEIDPFDPSTVLPFGFQQVFLRGELRRTPQ